MAGIVYIFLQLFVFLILIRVLLSWVQVDPYHPVVNFIYRATEPFLKPVRDILPPTGGFDFSPIIVLLLAQMIASIILRAAR